MPTTTDENVTVDTAETPPFDWIELERRWRESEGLSPTVDNPGFWTSPAKFNYLSPSQKAAQDYRDDQITALLERIGKKAEPKRKPLVYLAGPYSKPDPVENMHNAALWGSKFLDDGKVTPIIPHLTGTWHMIDPHPYEEWLAYDLEVMQRCDAVFRIPGESTGADAEVHEAGVHGIPVFYTYLHLYGWAETR